MSGNGYGQPHPAPAAHEVPPWNNARWNTAGPRRGRGRGGGKQPGGGSGKGNGNGPWQGQGHWQWQYYGQQPAGGGKRVPWTANRPGPSHTPGTPPPQQAKPAAGGEQPAGEARRATQSADADPAEAADAKRVQELTRLIDDYAKETEPSVVELRNGWHKERKEVQARRRDAKPRDQRLKELVRDMAAMEREVEAAKSMAEAKDAALKGAQAAAEQSNSTLARKRAKLEEMAKEHEECKKAVAADAGGADRSSGPNPNPQPVTRDQAAAFLRISGHGGLSPQELNAKIDETMVAMEKDESERREAAAAAAAAAKASEDAKAAAGGASSAAAAPGGGGPGSGADGMDVDAGATPRPEDHAGLLELLEAKLADQLPGLKEALAEHGKDLCQQASAKRARRG